MCILVPHKISAFSKDPDYRRKPIIIFVFRQRYADTLHKDADNCAKKE